MGTAAQVHVEGLTCASKGSCACSGADVRTTLHDRHRCTQNADHLAHNHPLSPFFAEVVCSLAATPPPVGAWPPPNGGNGVIRGVTRRRHAASHLLMLQTPTVTDMEGPGGAEGPGCDARGRWQGPAATTLPPPHFARNLSWSFFETPQKRCNSNNANSMFE